MLKLANKESKAVDRGGEGALWAAVMLKAIEDAKEPFPTRDRDDARRFILEPRGMFPMICHWLSISEDAARERIVKQWK